MGQVPVTGPPLPNIYLITYYYKPVVKLQLSLAVSAERLMAFDLHASSFVTTLPHHSPSDLGFCFSNTFSGHCSPAQNCESVKYELKSRNKFTALMHLQNHHQEIEIVGGGPCGTF